MMVIDLNPRQISKADALPIELPPQSKEKWSGDWIFESATHCSPKQLQPIKLHYTPSREKSIGDKSPKSKK